MDRKTVLICGAGVAGASTAFWLRRFGFDVTVVERAPAVRTGGYKVDIRGVAVDVVRRMGLIDDVRARATGMRTATQFTANGRRIATLDAELFGGRYPDDVELMRGDLNQILCRATAGDVDYRFDESVVAMTPGSDGVRVELAGGATETFDLVIGADGLRSATRRMVFGDDPGHLHAMGHHVSIFTVPNFLGLDRQEAVHLAPGRTVNVYSTGPGQEAKALFMFASPELHVDPRDIPAQQRALTEAMRDVGWQTPRLLSYLPKANDFYFDSLTQVRLPHWSAGRVALVGDSAYCATPASGQGTSLALVGGYVLAGELAAAGDHTAAFAGYERRMRDFVERNQALAANNLKGMVLGSATTVWIQTRMMRLLPHLPGKDAIIGKIAGAIHDAATAIELPEYTSSRLARN